MAVDRLRESNEQFAKAWQHFARSADGEACELPGLAVANAGVAWPILNAVLLASPVTGTEDLDRRISEASRYFGSSGRGWIFVACDEWIPADVRAAAADRFLAAGLEPEIQVTGMVAERLAPPVRPLPQIDVRRVDSAESRRAIADINSISYDVPLEWGRESVARERMWLEPSRGYVGYLDGQPVTSTACFPIDNAIYIALVATINQFRGTGFAETVMRHALEAAHQSHSIERSVLHATPAGFPIYQRMGYQPVTTFTIYLAAQP